MKEGENSSIKCAGRCIMNCVRYEDFLFSDM